MPVRDWTVGVEIADIVDVREGDADSNDTMAMIVVPTGVHYGTDVMTLATLTFEAVASGGNLNLGLYLSPGKFLVSSDNGKLLLLNFSTPSSAPSVSTLYTDVGEAPITAMAHAIGRDEIVFSAGNKVYTMPSAGGAATERADTETITSAGSELFDIDYSSQGWVLIIENADATKTTAVATEDWSSILTDNLPDALSASTPLQVNYTEETTTWIVARQDGEVVTTTDLDDWRPSGIALWAAVGEDGNVSYSSDGTSWTTYQAYAGTTVDEQAIAYGLNNSGDGIWMTPRWWDSANDIGTISDITSGQGGWTTINTQMTSGIDIAYGNGVWVAIGKAAAVRSTDGGATWTEVGNFDVSGGALNNSSVASDGAGNWVIVTHDGNQYRVWKSTDDAATWTASKQWAWTAAVKWYVKEISYGNGVWIMTTWDKQVQTCTDAGLATNAWTTVTTLPVSNSERPIDIQYAGSSKWMIVGGERMCYFSTDNGASWSAKTDVATGASYSGISATNVAYYDGAWIAVLNTATQNNIFKSTNDGTTWTAVANTGKNLTGIAYSSVLPNS
jgi:hypothetical protein